MEVIIKTIAGSHLFGLNTEKSDTDYKGVYLPSPKEILLGNYKDTEISSTGDEDTRNTSEDVDTELYSLRKFLKMLSNGDTAAIELLFTPDEFIIEKSPLWDTILENRDKLISKKVNAMIGYARQQANKYGIKGSRMGELNKVITVLKGLEKSADVNNIKMKVLWDKINEQLKGLEHVHFITVGTNGVDIPALDILGKKFDYHCTFAHVLQVLSRIYKNYGQRAREAKKNNGIDWKALSHATRVMCQGVELMETCRITLPHTGNNRDMILSIKKGELEYKEVSRIIEGLLTKLEDACEKSTLQETIPKELIEAIIYDAHYQRIIDV